MLAETEAYGLRFLYPAADSAVGRCLAEHGEFARPEVDFLLAYATDRGRLVDVGANIGSIALPFAAARPEWRVTALEAHRGLSGLLAANVHINRLSNVEPLNVAAGARTEIVRFTDMTLSSRGNFGVLRFGMPGHTVPVLAQSLDEACDRFTRIIKVDVEGHEIEVLKGAQRLLSEQAAVWLVEHSHNQDDLNAQVIATFQDAGYAVHWFWAPFATPSAPKGPPADVRVGDYNIVALPPGVPNLWSLPPVAEPTETPPGRLSAFGYLKGYGY